jgi:hypothetical protein
VTASPEEIVNVMTELHAESQRAALIKKLGKERAEAQLAAAKLMALLDTPRRIYRNPSWPIIGCYWDASGAAAGTGKVRRVTRK